MHNLLYQMRQTAAARIAAILKARPKEVMPSALHRRIDHSETGLPVNGAAPTAPNNCICGHPITIHYGIFDSVMGKCHAPFCRCIQWRLDDESAEFEQWEREAWGV